MIKQVKIIRLDDDRGYAYMELDSEGNIICARWIPLDATFSIAL